MGLSSNILWHQTKTGLLKQILKSRSFCFAYSKEVLPGSDKVTAFPMISFCNLPFAEFADYGNKYGGYSIGMSREWGMRNHFTPVLYCDDTSNIMNHLSLIGKTCLHNKNIKEASYILVNTYGGRIPDNMDELLKLPGVGRKIANLVLGDVYGLPSVVCDTHCMRICGRFGMYREDLRDPVKIEKILIELLPYGEGSDFCHRIVNFGREVCTARSPRCTECPLKDLCNKYIRESKNG